MKLKKVKWNVFWTIECVMLIINLDMQRKAITEKKNKQKKKKKKKTFKFH